MVGVSKKFLTLVFMVFMLVPYSVGAYVSFEDFNSFTNEVTYILNSGFSSQGKVLGVSDGSAVGNQTLAVVLIDYESDQSLSSNEEYYEAIFGGGASVGNFFKEVSYNKLAISGEVFGWYHPSGPKPTCYPKTIDALTLIEEEVDSFDYDGYLFLVNNSGCQGGFGSSSFGKNTIETPEGTKLARHSQVRLIDIPLPHEGYSWIRNSVIAHELLHSLGVSGHANAYECGNKTIDKETSNCVQDARQDVHDVMGVRTYGSHPNVGYKMRLGWMSEETGKTVSSDGVYNLYPLENLDNKLKAIEIPLGIPIPIPTVNDLEIYMSNLYLEYRQPTGFDGRLDHFFLKNQGVDLDGVMIRGCFEVDGNCSTTYLFDTKPNSLDPVGSGYLYVDKVDSLLNKGSVFYEPWNEIVIEVLSKNTDGSLSVKIDFDYQEDVLPDPDPDPEPQPDPEPESAPETEPAPESQPVPQPDTEITPVSEPDPTPEPQPQPQPVPASEPIPQTEIAPQPQIVPEPVLPPIKDPKNDPVREYIESEDGYDESFYLYIEELNYVDEEAEEKERKRAVGIEEGKRSVFLRIKEAVLSFLSSIF